MEIRTLGNGGRIEVCKSLIKERSKDCRYKRILLLPIPTTITEDKYIKGSDTSVEELLEACEPDCLAVGYCIPPSLSSFMSLRGADILDVGRDEDFLTENAELTAIGALGYILTKYRRAVSDMYIGIIGYGRIGKSLLRLLLFLGARVRVYTTRESVRLVLCEMGVECRLTEDAPEFSSLDILINTAPAVQYSEENFDFEKAGFEILELASGKNFAPSDRLVRLPALPAVMYPESSGMLLAKYILRKTEKDKGGGAL